MPSLLPRPRCALTAPFHPYRSSAGAEDLGGLLSVALSVGSRPPGVTWHLIRRSPDFPPSLARGCPRERGQRLPGRLPGAHLKPFVAPESRLFGALTPRQEGIRLIASGPRQLGRDGGSPSGGKLLR